MPDDNPSLLLAPEAGRGLVPGRRTTGIDDPERPARPVGSWNNLHSDHRDWRRIGGLLVVLIGSVVGSSTAGDLTVDTDAANLGTYGARMNVGSACTSANDVVLQNETVVAPRMIEGCRSITAGTSFVIAAGGTTTFTAGSEIVLQNGFSVDSGGTFTAVIDRTLMPFAHVQDDYPSSESTYNAEFFTNFDGLVIGAGDEIEHFVAYSSGATEQLRLLILTGPALVLEVREDSGTVRRTPGVAAAAGWNKITLSWTAAAGSTAWLAVNDGTPDELTGVNNDAGRIDFVRWGAVGGTVPSTSGQLHQDDFVSWR